VPADPQIGVEILGYRLEELIGRGGMGAVYRAYDRRLKRNVALKLVAPELSDDASFRDRFLTETEVAASLEHPNVVPVYDAGDVDGQLYLAMRYLEAGELKALLKSEGSLEPARALAICGRLAAALDAAHAHGLVHRDVKPSNVLLDGDEHVYLADFGLSRRLADPGLPAGPGPSLGTPAYVAPEQIAGDEVDGRADIYSLGCVLYECLTGEVPYERDSELRMLWAHLQDEPPVPASYPALAPVFATALAKDPDNRYATCAELVEAAREALGLREGAVVRDRKAILLTGIGAALAAAAIVAGVLLSQIGGGPSKPSTKPTIAPKVDSLQWIDAKTNKLAATIGLDSSPTAVAVGYDHVWIGTEHQSVLRVDPATHQVTHGWTTAGPNSIALGFGAVFAANNDGTLTRINPATLELENHPNSGYRWVNVGEGAIWTVGNLGLIRANREGKVVKRISRTGFDPFEVVAGGRAVWALDYTLRSLWKVDPQTNSVRKRIRLGFKPGGVAFGLGRVWVTNYEGDAVAEIDPSTDRIVRSIPVDDGPSGVAVGERSVWTANYLAGTVSRIDPRRGVATTTVPVGRSPASIAAGEGGAWVGVRAS
jgi:DNA-binding beta-propeller fold protein YncE